MSYFNEEQQDYMRELDSMSPEQKCICGWYQRGKCPHERCKTAEITRLPAPVTPPTSPAQAQTDAQAESKLCKQCGRSEGHDDTGECFTGESQPRAVTVESIVNEIIAEADRTWPRKQWLRIKLDALIAAVEQSSHTSLVNYLESESFYNLCQNYRHTALLPQALVGDAFQRLKQGILHNGACA